MGAFGNYFHGQMWTPVKIKSIKKNIKNVALWETQLSLTAGRF